MSVWLVYNLHRTHTTYRSFVISHMPTARTLHEKCSLREGSWLFPGYLLVRLILIWAHFSMQECKNECWSRWVPPTTSTLWNTHSTQVTWQPGAEQRCLGPPSPESKAWVKGTTQTNDIMRWFTSCGNKSWIIMTLDNNCLSSYNQFYTKQLLARLSH